VELGGFGTRNPFDRTMSGPPRSWVELGGFGTRNRPDRANKAHNSPGNEINPAFQFAGRI